MPGMYPDDQLLEIFGERVMYPGLDPETHKFTDGDFSDPLKKPSHIPAETFNLILDNLSELIVFLEEVPNNTEPDQLKKAITGALEKKLDKKAMGYGTCTTSASTADKVGTLADYVRNPGVIVGIEFSNANTAANPTLNVNETGAAAIIDSRTGAAATARTIGNRIHFFQFDGTNWVLINPIDENRYYVSFKITDGLDYISLGLIVNDSFFENEISGDATFSNITNAQFIAAMKTYFATLNTARKTVTIGGVGGQWQGNVINHISLMMVDSTTFRIFLNTTGTPYTFDLTDSTNTPQFAVNVSMLN